MLRPGLQCVVSVSFLATMIALSGCSPNTESIVKADDVTDNPRTTIESLIPPARLAKIKSVLPKVGFQKLSMVLQSSQTLWYDHESMTPSYQDSVGVNSNADWPRLVAKTAQTNPAIQGLHDARNKRWQFPFSATAGTDESTNIKVVNFLHLPHVDGKPLSIPIWTVRKNANRPSWMWVYPIGTMFGEVIFIDNNGELIPSEIRIRQRYASSWATNVYRPFPTARSLAAAVKAKRTNWQDQSSLVRLVNHLEDNQPLETKTLAAKAELQSLFRQTGGVDQIPDFNDAGLVKELLTTTPFVSSYGISWKESNGLKTFAPTTASRMSIVPHNYQAGLIEVSDDSCMRCHKESGRKVSEFYDGLYLYGEVWGKDGIFSFHPFDESEFNKLRGQGNGVDGYYDNRKISPKLSAMGVFQLYDAAKHGSALYPKRD
jgi:hypothetical protein